jgi:hypothetical protein
MRMGPASTNAAAHDLTNIAARINDLDAVFGYTDPHPLNDLAQRLDDACNIYLVRPSASHGFPAIPDQFAASQPLMTTIDNRLAALPPATDEPAILLHGLMQCVVMAAVSIGSALGDLRDIERRMEDFAAGSSVTRWKIASVSSLRTYFWSGARAVAIAQAS